MSAYKGLGFDDKVLRLAIDNDCIICGVEAAKYLDEKSLRNAIEDVLKQVFLAEEDVVELRQDVRRLRAHNEWLKGTINNEL